mgnify:FL=1
MSSLRILLTVVIGMIVTLATHAQTPPPPTTTPVTPPLSDKDFKDKINQQNTTSMNALEQKIKSQMKMELPPPPGSRQKKTEKTSETPPNQQSVQSSPPAETTTQPSQTPGSRQPQNYTGFGTGNTGTSSAPAQSGGSFNQGIYR